MSYTVLARRYRSQDFDDLIGQGPIAQTLANAVRTNRVAHAYLFCGTRGVGKTSMARILAKALNCEKGPTDKPCNQCDRCRAISAGEDIDVIEIDGASNRGIDEIRNLRSNAIFRPARAPFKIYIIDEVHMLTREAFNALLKTLEEPPSHVKFIFATTEPHKVPQTISSRCQTFLFRLIPTKLIAERLAAVCAAEEIQADSAVIERVARAGRGSMRDALSLMDQLVATGSGQVTEEMVEYLLGEPAAEQMVVLADALAGGDAAGALGRVDGLLAAGYAPEQMAVSLIEHLRRLLVVGVVGQDCEFVDLASGERPRLAEQARRFNPLTLVYMIQVVEQLRQSVRSTSGAARALVDAAVVRLALLEQFADTAELVDRLEGAAAGSGQPADGSEAKKKFRPAVADAAAGSDETPPAQASADPLGPPLVGLDTPLEQVAGGQLWTSILARLSQARMVALSGPLAMTQLLGADGSTLRLTSQPALSRLLSDPQRQEQLEACLSRLLSRPIRVEWVGPAQDHAASPRAQPAEAEPTGAAAGPPPPAGRLSQREIEQVAADPAVRQVMDVFDAEVRRVERKTADGPTREVQ